MSEAQEQERQRQRTELLAQGVMRESEGSDPATLRYVTEYDDLPELPDETLSFLNSKVVSTANLESEQVEAIEWHNEIAMLRFKQAFPPKYGLTGLARAFALDSAEEYRKPLSETDKIKIEGHGFISQLAATRSDAFEAVKTTTKDIRESILSGSDKSSGGLRGRLGR